MQAVALVGVFLLAVTPARAGTRLLLVIEGVTVLLILLVAVVVLVRLLGGSAPDGHTFDLSVFMVPAGTEVSALFLGVVFGFLSFAGFEAAATLGEEAREPRRDVPRAILGTAIFGGVYFVFVTAVEVMGFGTDDAGVAAFTSSSSLLGDLGSPLPRRLGSVTSSRWGPRSAPSAARWPARSGPAGCCSRCPATACCRSRWRRSPGGAAPPRGPRWRWSPRWR